MIVDSSALIALLHQEPSSGALETKLLGSRTNLMSAATFVEVSMVAERENGRSKLERLLISARIKIVPLDEAQARLAVEAFNNYGKGRHPAGLNLGDLFSYALAKHLDEPLLFVGSDFAKTDIRAA